MTAGRTSFRQLAIMMVITLMGAISLTIPTAADADALEVRTNTNRTVARPAADGSVAIATNGQAVIAYTTAAPVGVVAARCQDIACTTKQLILQDRDGIGSPEIALDAGDRAVMAYIRQGAEAELWLARCDTAACGAPTAQKIIEGSGPIDMALDTDGHAVIAFQHGGALQVLRCNDESCSGWSISVIDALGGSPSLALTSAENPVISYKSQSPRRTKIAVCSDATCDAIANLAEIPRLNFGMATSVAVDSLDRPVMAADDADGGIKLVRCNDPLCESTTTRGRDGRGADTASLALDASDNPVITYAASSVGVLLCTDPLCNDAIFSSFAGANYAPVESPAVVLDSDGRPFILYEGLEGRMRLATCGDPLCGNSGLDVEATYHVQNVATGEFLDPRPDGSVTLSPTATKRTRISLSQVRSGVYGLVPIDFPTFLDGDDDATVGQSFRRLRNAQWRVQISSDGSHLLRNLALGANLVAVDGEPSLDATADGATHDRWRFVPADPVSAPPYLGARVTFQNVATNRWLDADANGSVNQSVNRRADDVWTILGSEFGYVSLRNDVHDRYLDADRDTVDVRTSAVLGNDDLWHVLEVDDGVFALRNVRFDGYLDAAATGPTFNVARADSMSDSTQWRMVIIDEP